MPFFSSAGAASPSQRHSFAVMRSNSWASASGDSCRSSSCRSFRCWYCREAVQMGSAVNSVLKARNFL